MGLRPVPVFGSRASNGAAGEKKTTVPALPWRKLAHWEAATAFVLLMAGALSLFFLETPWRDGSIWRLPDAWVPDRPLDFGSSQVSLRDGMPYRARWTSALFVSATLRSAGIQSVPAAEGAMSWPSYALFCIGMWTGGSAGGVAGGARTSLILLIGICLLSRKRSWTSSPGGAAGRRMLLRRCLLFLPLWLLFNAASVCMLAVVCQGTWYELVFDGTAACNSVGLSTGLALHLTPAARMIMIAIVIAGRVVPVAYWLTVSCGFTRCLRRRAGGEDRSRHGASEGGRRSTTAAPGDNVATADGDTVCHGRLGREDTGETPVPQRFLWHRRLGGVLSACHGRLDRAPAPGRDPRFPGLGLCRA